MGTRRIEIQQEVVDVLADLNSIIDGVDQKQDDRLDNGFIKSALTAVVPPNEMADGNIDSAAIDFALGMVKIEIVIFHKYAIYISIYKNF